MCVTRHAQTTQNSKFANSLQYLIKEVSNWIIFLHTDKHETFLEIDTVILMEMVEHSQSSRNSKFAMSLQCLKKEIGDKVNFLHADKH